MSILCIRARFGTPIAHYRATLEVIWTHLYGCDLANVMFFFLLSILPWLPVWMEGLLWRRVTSLVAEAQKRVYGAVALDLTSKLPILSHNATSTTPMWWKGMHEILWYSLNARKNNWQGLLLEHQRTFQADVFLFNCLFWDILCPSLAVKIQIQSSVDIKERLRYPVSTADTAVPENRLQYKNSEGILPGTALV